MEATGISIFPALFSGVSAVVAIGLPVLLLVLCIRKNRGSLQCITMGALCFLVGARILEQMLHMAVFSIAPDLAKNIPLYCLYGCLAAGVFEETARLIGFRSLCKGGRCRSPLAGFAYGVGHGGIEAIMVGGVSAAMNAVALGQLFATQATADPETLAQAAALDGLTCLVPAVERTLALALQISLSMLMWMVVTKRLPMWGYPLAIVLHAVADVPAVLYQTGVITNLWLCMALILLMVLLIGAPIWLTVKKRMAAERAEAQKITPENWNAQNYKK